MGIGDQLIATGLARGAAARGKRIAFGDGRRICWDAHSEMIFRGNPNIARPGSEGSGDLEWSPYRKGNRLYNTHDRANNRWVWNEDFHPQPGEVFFTDAEKTAGARFGSGFALIEPNVERHKLGAANKEWGFAKYRALALSILAEGHRVAQFAYPGAQFLPGVEKLPTATFHEALAVLANAALYIGPEGGMHHGAAAVGVPGVVLFGGWVPPGATGYASHVNLTGGAKACGLLSPCQHCREAMDRIPVATVFDEAMRRLA